MNSAIRNILKTVYHKSKSNKIGMKLINLAFTYKKLLRRFNNHEKAINYFIKNINKFKLIPLKNSRSKQIKKLFESIYIDIKDDKFVFTLDELKNLNFDKKPLGNISIDYSKVINNSLNDYKIYFENNIKNQDYVTNQLELIESIELLIDRMCGELKKRNKNYQFFENIKTKKVKTFEEALQRILFFNQILWQTGHELNGLGRLDKILNEIYEKDNISKQEAYKLIKEFLKTLHTYYWYKSSALMGDTGQIIILGGKEVDGSYFYNELTFLFIEAIKELQLPDPKILLRVSDETPKELYELSLKTINTGVGSPLISNDDEIIAKMIDFDYDMEDAHNYVVSACWEPSAVGKGFEQNNINVLIFLKPLNELFDSEDLTKIATFKELLNSYKNYLKFEIEKIINTLNGIEWCEDPILSLFIDNCNEKQLDISKGGAKYNHYGITTVSLANTVDSLYNIKKLVFDEKQYDLIELNNIRKNNFKDSEDIRLILSNNLPKFGSDDEEILSLTNEIVDYAGELFNRKNILGGTFKFGLSAPSYISAGSTIKASFDGRKDHEPFSTHISSDENEYTDIMRFASKLHYDRNKFNGNVVDLMATPNFINDNFDKFTDFLMLSKIQGFFQMQMNVLDSDTLIRAKETPELYKNLIVRVWGFSSYFNDLPLEYKDLLIKRALKNEGKLTS